MRTIISFIDFLNNQEELEQGIDYFILEIPSKYLEHEFIINEGKWVASGNKNWMYRIDAQDPALKQQRHVHIAQSKHLSNKGQQVAWNIDGSKHDKKTFNSKIANLSVVQAIARQTLNLDSSIKLEETVIAQSLLMQLNETISSNRIGLPVFFRVL